MASTNFINECKNGANHNRLGKIEIEGENTVISESDNLASLSIDSGCFVDGNIIGSIYVKKLEGKFLALDDIELLDKTIMPKIGVKYDDSTTEYINMGKYTVERPNDLKTANKCEITAYDSLMNKLNEKYISTIDYSQGNITLQDVYIDVCNQLNLTPSTTSFINDDIPVENNPFTNRETNRIVLQTVAKIACSFVTIDEDTDEINLSWLGESNFVYTKNVYSNDFIYLSEYYGSEEEDKHYAVQTPLMNYDPTKSYSLDVPPTLSNHNYACLVGLFTANGTPAVGIDVFNPDFSDTLDNLPEEAKEQIKYLGILLSERDENSNNVELDLDEIKNEFYNFKVYETGERDFYEFNLNDYSTLEGGTIQYGPINSVIIKNSQVDDENVTMQDGESILENGEHSIVINEDYILYNAELRQMAITNIFNRLNGLKYVDSKIACYYGKPFLKIGDKIRIYKDSENYFDTYVLKHKFTYDGTFESIIESPALTEQEIKNKQDITLREFLRNTEIKVDKQNGTIELLNSQTREIRDDLNNNYYTLEEINSLISDAETGITNTFVKSGGNNILRNTGLWFASNDINNPYEYWSGSANKAINNNASSKTSIILKDGDFEQSEEVANGNYTISFKYQKLMPLATATVTINDRIYNLAETDITEFYTGQKDDSGQYIVYPLEVSSNQIDIKFTCDTDNAVEIYDLMCNQGPEKSVWSQNQNETTTDTVNISQGITIISNTKNTKFKADADGVRIFDKNDSTNSNPITEFTDKGMTTKEAIVENQATIVGVLRQQVGDQIWDCLII